MQNLSIDGLIREAAIQAAEQLHATPRASWRLTAWSVRNGPCRPKTDVNEGQFPTLNKSEKQNNFKAGL